MKISTAEKSMEVRVNYFEGMSVWCELSLCI